MIWEKAEILPDTKNYKNFTVKEFKLKTATPDDVDISIEVSSPTPTSLGIYTATTADIGSAVVSVAQTCTL